MLRYWPNSETRTEQSWDRRSAGRMRTVIEKRAGYDLRQPDTLEQGAVPVRSKQVQVRRIRPLGPDIIIHGRAIWIGVDSRPINGNRLRSRLQGKRR